ncbi:30S ribosomal protein S12 methylthiotransferase RimO [Candidatus Symbiobacter mobilis]|uniref:Ribosomal protein uS12 methylthiotransferase RimO n=1 Tax=Candidatus Symbiobacter mobilis CR TaxID=946483 RepID=U5N4N8_9BURK|nr:30S ribosomal protein S12 methylthiotransferase RimO [Candidatus Symbiobacter mobilis]AGX86446.1 ribosomal protein S12 methylthiotransferase [Candidatus Symbiobacter mobilis CR]
MTAPKTQLSPPPAIAFASLGCPKALHDSEAILTRLTAEGYRTCQSFGDADLVIVNTCGFIDDAVEESLDTIAQALSDNGKVIVTGCLGAKVGTSGKRWVHERHPKVLAVTGPQQTLAVLDAVHAHLPLPTATGPDAELAMRPVGIKLTPRHYAYIKISEGCNHHCTFCIIPSMRGRLVSRAIGDILQEARALFDSGVKELLVVSQDTGAYGVDVRHRTGFWEGRPLRTQLVELVRTLGTMAAPYGAWVRLHYVYPYPSVDALLPAMVAGHILPYLDVPFQHSHPAVLRRMQRPASGEAMLERIAQWRRECPQLALRSTFIVGFPGETEEEFEDLLSFLRQARIDHAGSFAYSDVPGAAANALPGMLPPSVREERRLRFIQVAQTIAEELREQRIGSIMQVLIDRSWSMGKKGALGRTYADSPEIDGIVRLLPPSKISTSLHAGEFVKARIIDVRDGALIAQP